MKKKNVSEMQKRKQKKNNKKCFENQKRDLEIT